jgi:hypothetical protein
MSLRTPLPSITPTTRRRLLAAAALTGVTALCGCQLNARSGELAEDQRILAACDKEPRPAADIQIDGTGSSADRQITDERMAAIADVARTTAVCSGRLRVSVFSSSTATSTLFEATLRMGGATANARLKRVPKAVDQAMDHIRKAYGPAVARLDRGGSDITAQYRMAGEWITQLGTGWRLRLVILTDGLQNVGTVKLGAPMPQADAAALAGRVTVPRLAGADIVVAGLGHVAGKPVSSATAEGLVAFYDALCHRASAARCITVTGYTTAGR